MGIHLVYPAPQLDKLIKLFSRVSPEEELVFKGSTPVFLLEIKFISLVCLSTFGFWLFPLSSQFSLFCSRLGDSSCRGYCRFGLKGQPVAYQPAPLQIRALSFLCFLDFKMLQLIFAKRPLKQMAPITKLAHSHYTLDPSGFMAYIFTSWGYN